MEGVIEIRVLIIQWLDRNQYVFFWPAKEQMFDRCQLVGDRFVFCSKSSN